MWSDWVRFLPVAHGICVCVFVASTVVVVVFSSSCISVAVLHSQTPVKLRYLLCDLPRWSDREAVFSIGWCISLPLFSSPFCLILSHPLLQYFVFLTLSFPCSVLSFLLTSFSLCFLLPCFVLSSLSSLTLFLPCFLLSFVCRLPCFLLSCPLLSSFLLSLFPFASLFRSCSPFSLRSVPAFRHHRRRHHDPPGTSSKAAVLCIWLPGSLGFQPSGMEVIIKQFPYRCARDEYTVFGLELPQKCESIVSFPDCLPWFNFRAAEGLCSMWQH